MMRPLRPLVAGLVLAMAVGGASGCSSKEERLQDHFDNAASYAEEGLVSEALLELRSALQLDPKNAETNFRIAEMLNAKGKASDALFFYRETTRLDPTRTDAALVEAKLILFDDTDRAFDLAEQVLEREPESAMAYVRLSQVALARGDTNQALQSALTAAELDADDVTVAHQIGVVQLARIRELRLRRERVPDELFEAAEAAFEKAQSLAEPGRVNPLIELGRLYGTWPNHGEQAKATFRAAVEQAGEVHKSVATGVALSYARAAGEDAFLAWALEGTVEGQPARLSAWAELARLREGQAEGGGAEIYKRLLAARPDDANAHFAYARFLVDQGSLDAGMAHLEERVAAGGPGAALALDEMSAIYLSSGDLESARAVAARLEEGYPTHARTALARARVAIFDRRYEDAAEDLRIYVAAEESAEGQRLLATAELALGNSLTALAAVDAAIGLTPGRSPALQRLKARIHMQQQDWNSTIAVLNRMRREGGALTTADRMILVKALYRARRLQQARANLEFVIKQENTPIEAYLEFAEREGATDPERADEYLDRVLTRQPRNTRALTLRVRRDLVNGNPTAALALLEAAAESGPLDANTLLLRARVHLTLEDLDSAEEDARRAFAIAPTATGALDLLAQIYTQQDRLDEAIESFAQADAAGALPPSGQVLLARLQLADGRTADARASYEKALAARSGLAGAKNDLAYLLADAGEDLERALTLAQEAQQALPESPLISDTLGYVYYRKELHEAAVQQFQYAIELAEGGSGAGALMHYHLGLALQALGRTDEAAAAFEAALAKDAAFPEAEAARSRLEEARASTPAAGPS